MFPAGWPPHYSEATAHSNRIPVHRGYLTLAANVSVSLAQSAHTASGTASVDPHPRRPRLGRVCEQSVITEHGMSGASAYTGMVHVGGASESFYNFYAQNSYSWSNGDSPASGSNNLTTNADLGSNGAGIRSTFSIASAGTYRKFYATTSMQSLSYSVVVIGGRDRHCIGDSLPLQKYEFTVEFTTDGADTLTLDIVKAGGSIILAYEAFSLAAVDVTPVPNLNIDSSFSFTNASTAETFQIPYSNNGQEPLSVTGVTVGGTDAAYFTVGTFDSSLAVGTGGNIALNFNPGAGDKVYNATLTVASNDSDSPNTVVNFSVTSGNVVSECVMDLFIVAGQSNANGLGERANFLSSTQAGPHDVKFFVPGTRMAIMLKHSSISPIGRTRLKRAIHALIGMTTASATGVHLAVTPCRCSGAVPMVYPEIGFAARALKST